jgi:hypothetical protein
MLKMGGDAMEVKTFTYEKTIRGYMLQGWASSERMDDHIAKTVKDGWKFMPPTAIPGDGRTFGPGVVRDKMTITFTKG